VRLQPAWSRWGIEKFSLTYARTTDVMGALRLVAGGAKLESGCEDPTR